MYFMFIFSAETKRMYIDYPATYGSENIHTGNICTPGWFGTGQTSYAVGSKRKTQKSNLQFITTGIVTPPFLGCNNTF